jgi:hypothetical protein
MSEDGSTLRRSLMNGAFGGSAEFINNATCRNKQIISAANGAQTGATIVSVAGDRLVVEIGYTDFGGGSTPQGAAKWGENATDLPQNETQTTDGAGWLETNVDIAWQAAAAPTRRYLNLLGAGI